MGCKDRIARNGLALLVLCYFSSQLPPTSSSRSSSTFIVHLNSAKSVVQHALTFSDASSSTSSLRGRVRARFDSASAQARAHAAFLQQRHREVATAAGVPLLSIFHHYHYSINAFAARLNPRQVRRLQRHPEVAWLQADNKVKPATTYTPTFINVKAGMWPAVGGQSNAGQGVVIGIIDTGIWPEHPSFSEANLSNVSRPSNWKGSCNATADFPTSSCNGKLIGARFYAKGFLAAGYNIDLSIDWMSARDGMGHGSWCAGAAAGLGGVTVKRGAISYGLASGIAPAAFVSVYKALWSDGSDAHGMDSDILAAVDQAVADGVDVLSLSIGGGAYTSYFSDLAYLNAAQAGVFAALAAGNTGGPTPSPFQESLSNAAPFYITVGASTTNRRYIGSLSLLKNLAFQVQSYAPPLSGAVQGTFLPSQATRACTAFLRVDASGKILICRRMPHLRLESQLRSAATAGAAAVVFTCSDDKEALRSRASVLGESGLPWAILTAAQSRQLKMRISLSSINMSGTFHVSAFARYNTEAPAVAWFSSRGPLVDPSSRSSSSSPLTNDVLKPDILGPGVDVWAAWRAGSQQGVGFGQQKFAKISGTSMATPHVAGVAAMIVQRHGDWSPAQIKSAIMTTARSKTNKRKPIHNDDGSATNAWSYGAGLVDGKRVLDPGLTFDVRMEDYVSFLGGMDAQMAKKIFSSSISAISSYNLNLPSIVLSRKDSTTLPRTVKRVVMNVGSATSTYVARVEQPWPGLVKVMPASFRIDPGQSVTFYVTFKPFLLPKAGFAFGSLIWNDEHGHAVRCPLGVQGLL